MPSFQGLTQQKSEGEAGGIGEFLRGPESKALTPQQVNSKAKGFDELANVFGQMSRAGFQQAESMAEEISTDALLQANSALDDVFTKSRLEIMADSSPDGVASAVKRYHSQIDSITKNTRINKGDRRKLDQMLNSRKNSLDLHAGELIIKNQKEAKRTNFYTSLPGNMNTVDNFINKYEFEEAAELGEKIYKNAVDLYSNKMITANELMVIQRAAAQALHKSKRLMESLGEDPNALDYQNLISSPFGMGSDATQRVGQPHDISTGYLYNTHLTDASTTGQEAAAIQTGKINIMDYSNLEPKQQEKIFALSEGSIAAENYIISNSNWNEVLVKYDDLKDRPSETLTMQEKGMKGRLEYMIQRFKSGNYNEIISDTVMGANIEQQRQLELTVINDGQTYNTSTPEGQQQAYYANTQSYNNYINKKIALGIAMHLPAEWIQPFDQQFANTIKASFKPNGDYNATIENIRTLAPEQRVYAINTVSKPNQQESLRTVTLARQSNSIEFLQDMIIANQEGINFDVLKLKDTQSDMKLKTAITSELSEIYDFQIRNGNSTTMLNKNIGSYGEGQTEQGGLQRISGMTEAAVNYVKFQAIKNNDLEMRNADKYIRNMVKEMNIGYDIKSGLNYSFNNTNLVMELSNRDASYVAQFAIKHAKERLKEHTSESQFVDILDRNPLFMTIDQFNNIIVTDTKTKSIIYTIPFSANFVEAALHEHEKEKQEYKENFPSPFSVPFRAGGIY
jgi:hypothetical protein